MKRLITSESVSKGHPDKIADQISDAILDEYLRKDPNSKVAVETMVKDNTVILGGEITSTGVIDYNSVVKSVVESIGYSLEHGFHQDSLTIINLIGKQSPEINNAVVRDDGEVGAGDQGFMLGYATTDTTTYMPIGIYISKKIVDHICNIDGFGPDVKSQVIVEEDTENDKKRIDTILISSMYDEKIKFTDVVNIITDVINNNLMSIDTDIFNMIDDDTKIIVNSAGEWNIGGPVSDCGVTGRKIVVDQYGVYCPVGGGAYSGKDFSKLDRSGSYLARYIAKNIVASGIANECKVEISYMIGIVDPSSLNIDTFGQFDDTKLINIVKKIFPLTPTEIVNKFNMSSPDNWSYLETAIGHYGNDKFPWEQIDMVDKIRELL